MKNKSFLILIVILILLLLTGCANTVEIDPCLPSDPYGFWGGLWHGLIISFSLVCSWFIDSISIYSVNNNGGWYNFGYWLGTAGSGTFVNIVFRFIANIFR